MQRQWIGSWFLLCCAGFAPACDSDDDSTTNETSANEETQDEPTTTQGEPEEESDDGAPNGDSPDDDGTPVQCGDEVCSAEELCLDPGTPCECVDGEKQYVQGMPRCEPRPSACEDIQDEEEKSYCWAELFCEELEFAQDLPQLRDGTLHCPNLPDCFGGCEDGSTTGEGTTGG